MREKTLIYSDGQVEVYQYAQAYRPHVSCALAKYEVRDGDLVTLASNLRDAMWRTPMGKVLTFDGWGNVTGQAA